jgi:hypothetical protein
MTTASRFAAGYAHNNWPSAPDAWLPTTGALSLTYQF